MKHMLLLQLTLFIAFQMLLDVASVFNTVSSLSRKEQSVKLTQDGLEVYLHSAVLQMH